MLVLAGLLALAANPRMEVAAGLGGLYRPGRWLPVSVTLENHGTDVEGALEIELAPARVSAPIELSAPARKRFDLALPAPWKPGVLTITVRAGANEIVSSSAGLEPLPAGTPLELHVVKEDERVFRTKPLPQILPDARVVTLLPEEVPGRFRSLDAADAVVLSRGAEESLREPQRQALRRFRSLGGSLQVEDTETSAPSFYRESSSTTLAGGSFLEGDEEGASAARGLAARIGLAYIITIAVLELALAIGGASLATRFWATIAAVLSFAVFLEADRGTSRRDRTVVHVAPGFEEAYVESLVSLAFGRRQEATLESVSPDVFFEPFDRDWGLSYESGPDGRLRVSGPRFLWERESLRFQGFVETPFSIDGTRLENRSPRPLTGCTLLGPNAGKPFPDVPPGGALSIGEEREGDAVVCDTDFTPELASFREAARGTTRVIFRLPPRSGSLEPRGVVAKVFPMGDH